MSTKYNIHMITDTIFGHNGVGVVRTVNPFVISHLLVLALLLVLGLIIINLLLS